MIHFAGSAYVAESIENPPDTFATTWSALSSLADTVLDSDVRFFVFSSSCATYGVPQRLPVEESSSKSPINPYGATKLFIEQVLICLSLLLRTATRLPSLFQCGWRTPKW